MKKVYLTLTIVFAFISCNCQKKAVEETSPATKISATDQETLSPKLEYVANTRGFYQKITIQNQMVTVTSDREGNDKGKTVRISDADWNQLMTAFKKIKLVDLPTFKDPTQKRFYDGAAIADLKVTDGKGKVYQTVNFDHEFPPVEIEKLVNKIVSFGKK